MPKEDLNKRPHVTDAQWRRAIKTMQEEPKHYKVTLGDLGTFTVTIRRISISSSPRRDNANVDNKAHSSGDGR